MVKAKKGAGRKKVMVRGYKVSGHARAFPKRR
jgi:hypothetical protein